MSLSWPHDLGVTQINVVAHTGADGFSRLARQAEFAGVVQVGCEYVLVDDFVGMGGTLANLKGYIESNGGRVLAAVCRCGSEAWNCCKIERPFYFVWFFMSVTELPVKTSRSAHRDGSRAVPSGLQKGQQTKAAIVDAALGLATQIGLEGLSIGALAEVMHMSKSGVFAHFETREILSNH